MPDSEGTKKHPDKKDVKQNKPPDREIKPLDVHSSYERLKGESEQRPQARETDQSQHPNDFSKGKSGDPYNLTGHFADMLKRSGDLTDEITRQLGEVTQKLEEGQNSKADVRDRTDAINPQRHSQTTLNRLADGIYRSFEDHMRRVGRPF